MKNKKDRAVLPKQKQSTFVGSKNDFEPDLDPKNSPNGEEENPPKDSKSEKRPKIWPN